MTSRIGDRTKTKDEAVFVDVDDVDKETYQKKIDRMSEQRGTIEKRCREVKSREALR